ncbi:MAG: response regulator [Desulfocapsa sp.]|nr:response regulator [Desulfocapsa sp.]
MIIMVIVAVVLTGVLYTFLMLLFFNYRLKQNLRERIAELEKKELRFREVFNNMQDGVAIYDPTPDGTDFVLKDLNPAGLRSSQAQKEDIIGRSVLEAFPGVVDLGLFDVFKRVWQTGEPENLPTAIYTDNRITLYVENHVYKLPSGKIVAIYTDTTQRKIAEDEMRRERDTLRNILNSMDDGVCIINADYDIEYVNPSLVKEYGAISDQKCFAYLHGRSTQCPWCKNKAVHQGKTIHWQWQAPVTKKTYDLTETPLKNPDGTTSKMTIFHDITEIKHLENQLHQSQKMEAIGTIAGGIAHDFNNILAVILGCAEFIRKETPLESRIREDIDEILTAGNRGADLVKQILTFSRQKESEKQVLQPHLIVNQALKVLRATLPATVTIEEAIDPDCGRIVTDPLIIHQIVVTLCSIGLQAMTEQKGTLRVELQRRELTAADIGTRGNVSPGTFVVLTVRVSGRGMEQQTMERIFEPYFTTKELGRGTGLGLAIIHGAVNESHGFIEVESSIEKGTLFSIYFPATEEPVTRAVALEDLAQKDREDILPGKGGILIVDDEPLMVKINERRLKSRGYDVTAVTDSNEALEIFRSQPENFDLLITDQTMPGLTGTELARAVLKIKPSLLVIMCTGHSDIIPEKQTGSMGINRYVFKPLHKDELLDAVQELLAEK